ncbi:MAG: YggS family pyridoxal phosphate enzyme, partial [Proteobacteria bacterium]|nr:YggS family pyridoxal phosphate enzyme [Pseudomonadota bacterium]
METLAKTELQQRYQQLKNRIHKLALSKTSEPELLAVSKSQPEESLRTIFACGQRRFGENYIQELSLKSEAMRDLPIEWIYIGHLQSNKIRKIVSIASEIQS